jgi:hypothetical protein
MRTRRARPRGQQLGAQRSRRASPCSPWREVLGYCPIIGFALCRDRWKRLAPHAVSWSHPPASSTPTSEAAATRRSSHGSVRRSSESTRASAWCVTSAEPFSRPSCKASTTGSARSSVIVLPRRPAVWCGRGHAAVSCRTVLGASPRRRPIARPTRWTPTRNSRQSRVSVRRAPGTSCSPGVAAQRQGANHRFPDNPRSVDRADSPRVGLCRGTVLCQP